MNKLDIRRHWGAYCELVRIGVPRNQARAMILPGLRRDREKFVSMGGAL